MPTIVNAFNGRRMVKRGRSTIYDSAANVFQPGRLARSVLQHQRSFSTVASCPKLYHDLARLDLLILDDWGLAPIDAPRRRDILEILDDRYNRRSLIVTSQFPVPDWHRQLNDPTIAEAILDRLVHTAYRIELSGPSMRADRSSPAIQKNSA